MALVEEPIINNIAFADKEDLWSAILGEVLAASKTKLSRNKSLLVVGHDGSGKSHLISRMKNVEEQDKYHCSGLDYRYIDVDDEDSEDTCRFGVWILHGNTEHKGLLKFAINENNIRDTVVMLVVDLSRPWDVISCLNEWTGVLKEHLRLLNVKKNVLQDMKDTIVKEFQEYSEPIEDSEKSAASLKEEEKVYLPLGEGVLDDNLGIPLIVVGTKTDTFPSLEKNHDYVDEHFDFIQQHLRKFCLTYGATLAYTSSKERKNVEIVLRYLLHRMFNFPFTHPASILEKDAVFIPSGWDSMKKISILYEHMKYFAPDDHYEERIIKPPSPKAISESIQVVAEDDQNFLSKHLGVLGGPKPTVASLLNRPGLVAATGNVAAVTQAAVAASIANATASGTNAGDAAGTAPATKAPSVGNVVSPRTAGQSPRANLAAASPKTQLTMGITTGGSSNKAAISALMKKPSDASKPGASTGSSEGVLANFFSSLLNKKSGGPATSTNTTTSSPTASTSSSRPTPPASPASNTNTSKVSSSDRASVLVKDLISKRISVRQNGNS